MFKADNKKSRSKRKICLNLTIKTSERNCKNKTITVNKCMFIVHQKKHLNQVLEMSKVDNKETQSLLLIFNKSHIFWGVSVADFE